MMKTILCHSVRKWRVLAKQVAFVGIYSCYVYICVHIFIYTI